MLPPTGTAKRRPYAARMPAEQRREQLLDAALQVIVREGYDAVSMDSIAREAGVTRPVVYGSFSGLGELLGALLDRQQARAFGQLTAALPTFEELGSKDGFDAAIRRMIQMVRDDPTTWQPVLFGAHASPGPVRERIEADRGRFVAQVAELIRMTLGEGSPGPTMMAQAVLAIAEHFGQMILADPAGFDDEGLVALVRRLTRSFGQAQV